MNNHKFTAGGLFIASLVLYIGTLAPSVVTIFDDSLEFQLVTYQLGIAHPTGYPLYTLLGKFFTFIPIGDVAYRVNLMSAIFGAVTVALVYLLILQVAPRKKGELIAISDIPSWPLHLGGIIGALLLAVGLVFWKQATVAEVYTLNAFFVVSLLLLVTGLPHLEIVPLEAPPLRAITRFIPTQRRARADTFFNQYYQKRRRGILWLAFLAGLSLTHHRTMLLLFPALAIYLYFTYKSQLFKPKILLLGILLFVLPLLLYLYLPWRGHIGSLDGTYQNTWTGFWRQVSASGYGLFIFDNPFGHERDFLFYWNLLADQFYTTVLGLIGIIYLFLVGQRRILLLTGVAFLTYLTFNLFYTVTDIEVFFIPNFLIWAVWSGVGATFLLYTAAGIKLAGVNRHSSQPQKKGLKPVLIIANLAVFALILFQLFRPNWAMIKQSYTWQVHDYGLDIFQQSLPPVKYRGAVIVGILGETTLIRYFQQTEIRRPDIETVAADLEAERLTTVENLLAEGRSVYLTRELPGAPERWSLSAVGPLIRVNPEPLTTPPQFSFAANQPVTPEITLLGYNLSRPSHHDQGPAPLRLTLFWQVNDSIATDLKVSARLLTPSGEIQAVTDAIPVHFAYPTTTWRPGEIISDVYDLDLPLDTSPGQYTPLIIWYDPAQNAAEVGRVELVSVPID